MTPHITAFEYIYKKLGHKVRRCIQVIQGDMITGQTPGNIAPFPTRSGAANQEFSPASAGGNYTRHFIAEVEANHCIRDVDRLDFVVASQRDGVKLADNPWKNRESITHNFYELHIFRGSFAHEWMRSPPTDIVKDVQQKACRF